MDPKVIVNYKNDFLPVGIWAVADACSARRCPLLGVPLEAAVAEPTSPPVAFAPATADPYADNAAVDELNEAACV